jgi:extracellular elastinolytic metalloproteinase
MVKRLLTSALAVTVAAVPLAALPVSAEEPTGGASTRGLLTQPADGEPSELAVEYLTTEAAEYGLTASDVAELAVRSVTKSRHSGANHVNLNQQLDGLEVFGADLTITIAADGSVAFVGGTGVSGLAEQPGGRVELDPVEAVEAAADALDLEEPDDARIVRQPSGPAAETVVVAASISDSPIPAKLGWQPVDGKLRLAWQLVIDDASDVHLWNATVDAATGALLDVDDWTSDSDHQALTDFLRTRGDASETGVVHVANVQAASGPGSPAIVTPDPVPDGSSYNVFALPRESPNDGGRTVVTNPADAVASPFGWHDTDGAPGPEFTITRGNNTHAYFDQDANNQPDPGFDVDGGPSLTFDAELDHDEHAQTYRDAVLTNLFYWCNVSHDVFYRYGFDEVSGNFQANNYGRGGVGGDYVRCEAADGGGTNNANFSTPANDGGTPRMQMYLWPGNQFGSQNQVIVDGVGTFGAGWARFAAAPTNAGLADREIVVAGNGCDAAAYPATLPSGPWMALADGATTGAGSCTNVVRSQVAQAQGADALLVASTGGGAAPILTGAISLPRVEIPVVSLSQADGNAIKAAVAADITVGTLRKNPDHPGIRDGDLEAGIVIHEYSHGVSLRLTGGPGVNCLSGNEQMGEGWSDYHAIAMLLDPALDDPEGPRGMGPYALFQPDRTGNGIRPRPYSRDMTIQPFTYDRIMTNGWITGGSLAVPHGIGHAWAATLWDMTWDLTDRHGFNPNVYEGWDTGGNNLAYQLVMDGLKIQGCGPGFVVGRDAIITADQLLTGGDNECLLWTSFARRGLGYSAVQGTTNRNDNTEAFDVPPQCTAPGTGLVGPQFANAPALNVRAAGSTLPVQFNLGGDLGVDPLKSAHSPASQQISCETLEPLQYAITEPTDDAGSAALRYNRQQQRYQYNWQTREDWANTCRQLMIVLEDGTQHRANFRFTEPD